MRRPVWLVVPAAAAALALPAASSAHAFLIRSIPTAGSAVAAPPRSVVLDFDEPVSPAHIDVTRTDGTSVRAGKPHVPKGRPTVIVVPLRPNLPHGGYVVHWSEVDEDDGHVVSGVFSFAIGADQTAPAVSASGGSDFRPRDTVARWLLLAGLLVAAGIALFRRFVWPVQHGAVASAAALALAAGGAVLLLVQQPGLLTTRFDKLTLAGAVGAAAASLVALASLRLRGLLVVADVAAVLLLALPTLDGHAVARGPSHLLSVPSDLVHLLSASVWIGGLFSLIVLVRPADRAAATRRFAPFALAAVGALALTGVLRAIGELRSVSQLWSTSYGNAILVKTVLFATVIAIAAAAHRRPRRQALLAEGAILFVLLGAVAVLVGLRPGRDVQTVATLEPPAFVTAAPVGTYAVGVELAQAQGGIRARATVLGQEGPSRGLAVTIVVSGHAVRAASCGDGCYQTVAPVAQPTSLAVRLARGSRSIGGATFRVPQLWPAPSAAPIVARATQVFRALHSVTFVSRLASSPSSSTTTLWKTEAPNRLAGIEQGSGAGAVIIGSRRWDRDSANDPWVESSAIPLRQPSSPWPATVRNARFVGSGAVRGRPVWLLSFEDPTTPAWFRIAVDKQTGLTYSMDMVATAHFMREDYGRFNAPLAIKPP